MNLKILIAKTVTIDEFYDFADGEDKAAEYEYDAMGRLTADHNKGIVLIGYNVLGLPSDIWVNGGHARYTYDADGTLLCRSWGVDEIKPVLPVTGVDWGVTVTDPHIPVFRESSRREWCGDFEYADGAFERMRHSAGWLGADGRHTAEIKDYQGNVRATWTQGNQKTTNPAAVEKGMWYDNVTGYYPYGLPWASMQGQESRLYSGKELDRMHALNLYDFHARLYDPQLGRFLSPDPCSTQYEPLSPYLYCAANPILLTDPTGMYVRNEEEIKLKTIEAGVYREMVTLIIRHAWGYDQNPNMYAPRLTEMALTLQDIQVVRNDETREYLLDPYQGQVGESETKPQEKLNEKGHQVISVRYNGNGLDDAAHEMKHAGQIAREELVFANGKTNYGLKHEVEAYKAQFGINGFFESIMYDENHDIIKRLFQEGMYEKNFIYDINKITPKVIKNMVFPKRNEDNKVIPDYPYKDLK